MENTCPTCHGEGYVVEIVGQSWGNPYGEPVQEDCPTCSEAYHDQVERDIEEIEYQRTA